MKPQAIQTRNRSPDEHMAEIESGETYSGIKFKCLNSWVTEVLQSVLNSKFVGRVEQGETRQVCLLIPAI
jgi:hypothetical protein